MKKIFIDGYFRRNLGDDLFFYILQNRYNEQFYAYAAKKYAYDRDLLNIEFNKSNLVFYLNKIIGKLKKEYNYGALKKIKKMDYLITIGGSVFIEPENIEFEKLYKKYDILENTYVIGANFGPYKTEKYKEYINKKIKAMKDVCFRDEYSYKLFKQNNNVRFASDIVFSLDTKFLDNTAKKMVTISVIDLSNRDKLKKYQILYERKIIELIIYFKAKGYNITLMSFCKDEGDEKVIRRIKSELDFKIDEYFYRDNIVEALNVINSSQIIVGTRFHANILGLVMNKTIIPIAYSDKTINALKDINYKGKIYDIRKIHEFDINKINEDDLNYKIDVNKQKRDAHRHFEILDKVLDRKDNNE